MTVETLYERVLEDSVREAHKQLYGGERTLEVETFRSEVSALTREFLEEWRNSE